MLRFILPIAYMIGIYLLSSIPGDATNPSSASIILSLIPSSLQNLLHIPLFAGLFLSFQWAFSRKLITQRLTPKIIVFTCIIFAAFDEFHQMAVPGRFASASDFFLDTVGVITGLFMAKHKSLSVWLR
ncbi:MAG: hypothetical protein COB26_02990 [Piscirickettsiaceae bacterium]|nr:MAG: hypothetical protein COB26_02990 [Piscirickettsiaceae bacterium]